jgi:pimeloyl-ACP methyl ester carboxylesterase
MTRQFSARLILLLVLGSSATAGADDSLHDRVRHDHADSNGVKIHYVTLGKGPLVVMIHGFPDYWYTWRHQMAALADSFQVVAIDMRGYNRSDKPKGVEKYDVKLLVGDVAAVIKHVGAKQATIVGHDWGGMVAWQFAMALPRQCSRLIILNLPHPRGLSRELAHNPQQQKNSAYARAFQLPGAHKALSAEGLARWVKNKTDRAKYVEAFKRSDFEAMLNYYKKNYPRMPYKEDTSPVVRVQAPVLMFHGLNDRALLPAALNGTWKWVGKDLTLVTVPGAGHFVQQDASELVSRTMKMWLKLKTDRRTTPAG